MCRPRCAVLFVSACTALLIACMPRAHLCMLLPLNCTLLLALQALLVYLAHFRPASSARAVLQDSNHKGSKYRRMRARLQCERGEEEDDDGDEYDDDEDEEDESEAEEKEQVNGSDTVGEIPASPLLHPRLYSGIICTTSKMPISYR